MTILFAGTSDADLDVVSGGVNAYTSAGVLSPDVTEGIEIHSGGVGLCALTSPATDFWVSFYTITPSIISGTSYGSFMSFPPDLEQSNVGPYRFQQYELGLILSYFNGSTWNTVATYGIGEGNLNRYDIHIKIDALDGYCKVYTNNNLIMSHTGADTTTGGASVGALRLSFNATIFEAYFSAIFVADTDSRPLRFMQLPLTGDGTLTDWTGSYTDIDEAGYNDSDFISSDTGGEQLTVTSGITVPEGYDINTLVMSGRMSVYGSAVSGITAITYQGGTSYDLSAFPSPDFYPSHRFIISETNPMTGLPWTAADINTGEFGFKTVA